MFIAKSCYSKIMSKERTSTSSPKKFFSDYESLILTVFQNATSKLVSAIELYSTKYAYNESYFLSVIAQEEMAKLVIIPIAKELGELERVVNDRSSAFYKHPVKQKIFTNFGLQNRTHEDIESIKQASLYVSLDSDQKPQFKIIKPEIVLSEIKHACLFLANNYRTVLLEETFSENAKKGAGFFMKIVYGCVTDKLPEIHEEIDKDAKKLSKKTKEELEQEVYKALFTNPYELIKIFKAIFKEDYKKHLRGIGYFSIEELEKYLAKLDIG